MNVFHTIAEFRAWRRSLSNDARVPFVPTMGALHAGHGSLVRQAQGMCEAEGQVAASIFVNPTQFGPREDFSKYPRTLDADLALLAAAGCAAVFVPSAPEMYPRRADPRSAVSWDATAGTVIDPGAIARTLEGSIRPGHFQGVCGIVAKLLNIVRPTHLLLGQKDYQQLAVLRQMCTDLDFPVEVVACPTVREFDGLAMSSRNRYLSAEERPRAAALFEALSAAKKMFDQGERDAIVLEAAMDGCLAARGLLRQYAVVADCGTLALFRDQPGAAVRAPAVLLIAATLGSTRLIDNLLL